MWVAYIHPWIFYSKAGVKSLCVLKVEEKLEGAYLREGLAKQGVLFWGRWIKECCAGMLLFFKAGWCSLSANCCLQLFWPDPSLPVPSALPWCTLVQGNSLKPQFIMIREQKVLRSECSGWAVPHVDGATGLLSSTVPPNPRCPSLLCLCPTSFVASYALLKGHWFCWDFQIKPLFPYKTSLPKLKMVLHEKGMRKVITEELGHNTECRRWANLLPNGSWYWPSSCKPWQNKHMPTCVWFGLWKGGGLKFCTCSWIWATSCICEWLVKLPPIVKCL